MFKKIKQNLMKYFGKNETESKEIEPIKGVIINEVINDNSFIGVDFASGEDKTVIIHREIKPKIKKKVNDPKEKLKIKLQIIAKRTKSRRIRKKNLKRLVSLY